MAIGCLNNVFQARLFLCQFIKVGIRFGIGGIDLFQLFLGLSGKLHASKVFHRHVVLGIGINGYQHIFSEVQYTQDVQNEAGLAREDRKHAVRAWPFDLQVA